MAPKKAPAKKAPAKKSTVVEKEKKKLPEKGQKVGKKGKAKQPVKEPQAKKGKSAADKKHAAKEAKSKAAKTAKAKAPGKKPVGKVRQESKKGKAAKNKPADKKAQVSDRRQTGARDKAQDKTKTAAKSKADKAASKKQAAKRKLSERPVQAPARKLGEKGKKRVEPPLPQVLKKPAAMQAAGKCEVPPKKARTSEPVLADLKKRPAAATNKGNMFVWSPDVGELPRRLSKGAPAPEHRGSTRQTQNDKAAARKPNRKTTNKHPPLEQFSPCDLEPSSPMLGQCYSSPPRTDVTQATEYHGGSLRSPRVGNEDTSPAIGRESTSPPMGRRTARATPPARSSRTPLSVSMTEQRRRETLSGFLSPMVHILARKLRATAEQSADERSDDGSQARSMLSGVLSPMARNLAKHLKAQRQPSATSMPPPPLPAIAHRSGSSTGSRASKPQRGVSSEISGCLSPIAKSMAKKIKQNRRKRTEEAEECLRIGETSL